MKVKCAVWEILRSRPIPLLWLQDPVADNSWSRLWRTPQFLTFLSSKHSADKKKNIKIVLRNNDILWDSEWVIGERSVFWPSAETCQRLESSRPPGLAQTSGGFRAPAPASVPGHNSAAGQSGPYRTSSDSRGHCVHPPAACQNAKH